MILTDSVIKYKHFLNAPLQDVYFVAKELGWLTQEYGTHDACTQGLEANITRSNWLVEFTLRVNGYTKEKQKQTFSKQVFICIT